MVDYSVQAIEDGVAVLEREGQRNPELEKELSLRLATPLKPDPRKQSKKKP